MNYDNNIINNNIIINSISDLDENSVDQYIKYEKLNFNNNNNNINNSFIINNKNYDNIINNENNINSNNNISYTEIKPKNILNNLTPSFFIYNTEFKNKYKTDYNFNNYKNKKDNLDDSYLKKEIRNNQSKLLEQKKIYIKLSNFINQKNDKKNYPYLSFNNYKNIDQLSYLDENYLLYDNFLYKLNLLLLKKELNRDILIKYINLLTFRRITSYQTETKSYIYPFYIYILLNNLKELTLLNCNEIKITNNNNFYFVIIIKITYWNIIHLNIKNFILHFYLFEPYKKELENDYYKISENFTKEINKYLNINKKWSIYLNNLKDNYKNYNNNIIMPLIYLDYISRNNFPIPIFDRTEIDYYSILIIFELMNNKLLTI